jgi:cell division transport system permease protein
MKYWLNQHQQSLSVVFHKLKMSGLSTLIMCLVMGTALSLPALLYVIVDNFNHLAGDIKGESRISLFLKLDVEASTINQIKVKLEENVLVKSFEFVSKETALNKFKADEHTAEVASNLENNPLPDAFFVQASDNEPAAVNQLRDALQQYEGVELAQVDASWIQRLSNLLKLGKKAVITLAVLLGFAIVVIIGNTIRLQILTQKEEIEVSKLVGATNSFIRRPFLYTGALYGLGGGLAAWLILVAVVMIFNASIEDLAKLYASNFHLNLPSASHMILLVLSGVGLGWLGSYLAVNRSISTLNIQ